jgi:hypothetical protein
MRRLGTLLAATVPLVFLGEWGVRSANLERLSYTNPALYEPDETLGYRMRPNARVFSHGAWFKTNAAGLRGPHWEEAHEAGRGCVLFLGHSIVAGFGVTADQSIPGVFTRTNSRDLVGINAGHCAYRYWQELPLAMELLPEVRPVATVVMFTANEFEPQYDPFTPTNIDGMGPGVGTLPIPGKGWLRRHSALYSYLRKRWNRLMIVMGQREVPVHFEYASIRGWDAESREHYRRYERQLWQLKNESRAPLILTAFPMGQSRESYMRLEAIAQRVGAHWVHFEDLFESEADYRRRGALSWSEHPDARTQRRMGERLTAAVEDALAQHEPQ